MRALRNVLFVSLFLVAGVVAGWSTPMSSLIKNAGLDQMRPDTKLLDFTLDRLGGDTLKLSSLEGKVVLLNFFATWCGPCRSEMPDLEALYQAYKDKGFVVVAVDLQDSPENVASYVKKLGLTFPVLLDRSGQIGAKYGARAIPLSYIIDKKGIITSGAVGVRSWQSKQAYALIAALLEQ